MMRWPAEVSRPVVSVSSTIWRMSGSSDAEQLVDGHVGETVYPLVAVVAGMALHPVPAHLMAGVGFVEGLPQILVLHRLLVGGLPAALLPGRQPDVQPVHHVLGVG